VNQNAQLINVFYGAFQRKDGDAMARCYHADVQFADPVFPDLKGGYAGAMWRMLCGQAKDLTVEFSGVEADDQYGKAHWEATYTFSVTGRQVFNVIDATFEFKDGLIVRHTDVFDFWKWSRMALGASGLLLGWTPIVRSKVQGQAAKTLAKFVAAKGLEPAAG
jgi:ketosteroid isomerase-like protein